MGVLRPEEWNNIPVCIVTAFKHVISANELNYQTFKHIEAKIEGVKQYINNQGNKFDRELSHRDEILRKELNTSHKDLSEKMETKHKELFNLQDLTQKNVDR